MENPVAIVNKPPEILDVFSKFARVNNSIISEFVSSVPETFSQCVEGLKSRDSVANDFVMQNRIKLKPLIAKFHSQAQTLTKNVEGRINMLGDPESCLVFSAHQPNLFPYSGVFKKLVLLDAMKRKVEQDEKKKIVNLFLIVDHDFIDEAWMRMAQLPSVRHSSGILELRLPVSNSKRWNMVCNTPPPNSIILNNWKRQIRMWIRNQSDPEKKSELMDNFEDLWDEVELAYSDARSYSDLNSFLMSRIVNRVWGYDTVFVRLSEMSEVFENGFTFLLSNFKIFSDALRKTEITFMQNGIDTGVSQSSHLNAPVWLHCNCGSKASVKILTYKQELFLSGPCMSCKKDLRINIGNPDNIDISKHVHDLSPRAIPIPLLMARDLGAACYATGTGGIGYLVDGSVVSRKLSSPLPLVVVWPSKDQYIGIGQARALSSIDSDKKSSGTFEYVESLQKQNEEYEKRIRPMLEQRKGKVMACEPIDDLLCDLFALKERQRNIRMQLKQAEKIHNATTISPCFVDYAVNFGIKGVEKKWSKCLVENNRLSSTVFIPTEN